jgi:hypothetical protein
VPESHSLRPWSIVSSACWYQPTPAYVRQMIQPLHSVYVTLGKDRLVRRQTLGDQIAKTSKFSYFWPIFEYKTPRRMYPNAALTLAPRSADSHTASARL